MGSEPTENDGKKGLQNMLTRSKESDFDTVSKFGIMEVPVIPPWSVMVDDPASLNDPDREKISVFPVGLIAPKQATMVPMGMKIMGFMRSLMPSYFTREVAYKAVVGAYCAYYR